jgi:PAS domain S-box-containing protein
MVRDKLASVSSPRARAPLDVLCDALEGSPNGVVVSVEDGTIQFMNVAASAIFDYPPGALIGQPLSRVMPEAMPKPDAARFAPSWKSPGSAARIASRAMAGIRRDGEMVPLEVALRAIDEGTTRFVIASIVDVTERLDLEARLAAATNARLGVPRLVADVAVRVGVAESGSIDDAIADGLREIGETLQIDCAMLWRWPSDETSVPPVQQWVRPSCPAPDPFSIASIPFVVARLKALGSCCFTTLADLPDPDREAFRRRGLRSGAVVSLASAGDGTPALSALALGSMTREQEWAPTTIEHLRLIAGVMSQAHARLASHDALQKALDENRRMRERVVMENAELRREVKVLRTSRPIVSESDAIQQVLAQVEQVAPTPATVLLLGETGTGKEVMAQAIHDLSPRHQRPMIRVSCAAIPTSLIESELFGRERGAYTGALSRQIGRFEAANQSTLFLDEIGDLPMEVQVKLLRVLQERVIERLGSTQSVKVDVRIIAATNRNLDDAVRDKTFREDLFYRLNVFPVVVPPLRERVKDIPALVWSFIDEFSKSFGKTIESISKDSLRELQRYPWPGNVRELRNVIERAVILATGRQLVVAAPRAGDRPMPQNAMTLTELEVEHIRAVLKSTGWRVRGTAGAAERLGIKPTTLESRMAKLGITRTNVN